MAANKPKKHAPVVADAVVERVVGLLVTLRCRADVIEVCGEEEQLQLSPAEAAAAIDEAQRRINLAAAIDFERELGTAKTRLVSLFERATDPKDGLAVQKEINKLLDLYPRKRGADPAAGGDDGEALEQLAAARAHLAPLVHAGDDEPLDEIARRVVALFTSKPSKKPAR